DSPRAFTVRTRILDDPSGAATNVAGPRDREKSLLVANLAGAATSRTGLRLASGCGTRAFTGVALLETRNSELRRHAISGFFECELQVVTKIRAALCGGATTATRAAKHIAKSKQVAEDVFDPTKSRCAPRTGTRAARNTCVAKTVIAFALFVIRQHAVGFRRLFEFLFGRYRVRVLIRMML